MMPIRHIFITDPAAGKKDRTIVYKLFSRIS